MATFRFDLNEEYGKRLEDAARENRMSIQEYIRYKLFGEKTIFSVDEVIQRIQAGNFEGIEFTVPDVYTDEEWSRIDRGNAGVLGKNFYNHVTEHPELGICFLPNRTINRRAAYTYTGPMEKTIFTVEEVVKRVKAGGFEGIEFTVPDVYTDEEWSGLDRSHAGVLGRKFNNHVLEHPELGIRFLPDRTIQDRAVYTYTKPGA